MIKILFLSANPKDTTRLRLAEEAREIDSKLQATPLRGTFTVEPVFALRVSELQSHLMRHMPQIVHFSGHGSDKGEIILEDDFGEHRAVPIDGLQTLFSLLGEDITCVVLNACFSERQAAAIAENIPFVIGMSGAIGTAGAIAFAASFYQALGYHRTIEEACKLGCNQLQLNNLPEHMAPKLISKEGADPKTSRLPQRRPLDPAREPAGNANPIIDSDDSGEGGKARADGHHTNRVFQGSARQRTGPAPPLRYVVGVAGVMAVAAAVAIVRSPATNGRIAAFGVAVIVLSLGLSFGLAGLGRIASGRTPKLLAVLVSVAFVLLIATDVSSVCFKWPVDLGSWGSKIVGAQQVARYAWSRERKVYHYANCCWVKRISPENLVTSDSEPPGKSLHSGCPTVEGTGGCPDVVK